MQSRLWSLFLIIPTIKLLLWTYVKNLFLSLPSWENFEELSFLPGQNLNLLFGIILFTLFLQFHVMTSLSFYISVLFYTFLRLTEMSYVFDHHMSGMTHLSLFHHHSRKLYHLNCSTKINYLLWFSLYVISCQLFPSLVIIIQFFLCIQSNISHYIYWINIYVYIAFLQKFRIISYYVGHLF